MFTKKLPVSIATFMAASFILLSFEAVRKPGVDSLAAASVANIVKDFAAQSLSLTCWRGCREQSHKRTYKLRALMSIGRFGISQGLRCLVCKRLLFIQQYYTGALSKARNEFVGDALPATAEVIREP